MSGARDRAAATAFEAYLGVRSRLPAAEFEAGWQSAESLAEIAGPFDLVLLDAYGVLNVGESPIPGAAEAIAALRAAGKAVAVVSNSAAYPKRVMMQRYARLGFDFAPEEVVTSREALLAHLARAPRLRWGAMLSPDNGMEEFENIDLIFLGDDPAAYAEAQGFLLIGTDGWTETRQSMLEAALRAHPRPVVVGNPDIVAPRETGLSLEPGHFAHRLADAVGIAPVFLGKPFAEIYTLALSQIAPQIAPGRVLMVGDTLHTDILGGRQMGFATSLVTGHGALLGLDPAEAIRRSGIVPDFVIASIGAARCRA
ncbi:HAD-IIA family hydrolase [Alloyangia pacifica]|uniref:HAD-superfamily class IIA hydrolase, TIGR01459 n=1 Tax=Alloyangia pacifica TaxID=311180 RepID=A0A1I6VI28_9RHOB|nr:HAD-IIA family hydrolase [Alloyangia pacifica]SDH99414.1 HAD-superfamily class IIA hydrolase, TIGR01459 [Alloyangia pacifica]SFT13406.1 HAD-superfamily class IIA hydrolase, TIGR01459 [Alloyangia pacifica]